MLVFEGINIFLLLYRLAREFLTKVCSRHLAEVIRKNQRLREIEFSLKKIDGKIAEVLYEALKHVKCGAEMLQ